MFLFLKVALKKCVYLLSDVTPKFLIRVSQPKAAVLTMAGVQVAGHLFAYRIDLIIGV